MLSADDIEQLSVYYQDKLGICIHKNGQACPQILENYRSQIQTNIDQLRDNSFKYARFLQMLSRHDFFLTTSEGKSSADLIDYVSLIGERIPQFFSQGKLKELLIDELQDLNEHLISLFKVKEGYPIDTPFDEHIPTYTKEDTSSEGNNCSF